MFSFCLLFQMYSPKRTGNVDCRNAASIYSSYIRALWWLIGSAHFLPNRQTQSLVRFIDKNNSFPHDNRKSTGQIRRGFPCKDRSSKNAKWSTRTGRIRHTIVPLLHFYFRLYRCTGPYSLLQAKSRLWGRTSYQITTYSNVISV